MNKSIGRGGVVLALLASVGASALINRMSTDDDRQDQHARITVVDGAAARSATGGATLPSPATLAQFASLGATPDDGFVLGVQTHFNQGWSPEWLALAGRINARALRDTVNWASVETKPGQYDFSGVAVATLDRYCAGGGRLSLTIIGKNPLYDGGAWVSSGAGQTAFANYLGALGRRFGTCLMAVEVGNEINNYGALDYPAGTNVAATYVSMMRTLYPVLKSAAPAVAVLGGSTLSISTGYMRTLFAAGLLSTVDGVAVHPYRASPEGIEAEILRLRSAMQDYGTVKPIWATEYSFAFADQQLQASALVKSVVQLYAAGVTHANWYALVEQRYFPNMGLFSGLNPKAAATAFRSIQGNILGQGAPVRIDTGDRPINLYQIGPRRWVVWGADTIVNFSGAAVVRDIYGKVVSTSSRVTVSDQPVVVKGPTAFTIEDGGVVADSLRQFGRANWSYWRRNGAGVDTQLGWYDDPTYDSVFADRWTKPLAISNTGAIAAGTGASPTRAVIRYTAPRAMTVALCVCMDKTLGGDGMDYLVQKNGGSLASGIVLDSARLSGTTLSLAAGDRVDVSFGPNQLFGNDKLRYRIVLGADAAKVDATCANGP